MGRLSTTECTYLPTMSMEGHGISWWEPLLRVCFICMVYVLICSRPCYISSCGRRDREPYVTRVLSMSQLWNSKR